jgi:hypothetical protein
MVLKDGNNALTTSKDVLVNNAEKDGTITYVLN